MERNVFYLLFYSPEGLNNKNWARVKPGTRISIWDFLVGSSTWTICCCFSRFTAPIWVAVLGRGLTHCTMPALGSNLSPSEKGLFLWG